MKKVLFTLSAIALSTVFATAEDVQIIQKDKEFYLKTPAGALEKVKDLTIKKGDKITFSNEDKIVHNIYARGDVSEAEIPKQDPGSSDTIAFDKSGNAKVRCAIHPRMKLKVKIDE